MKTDLHIHTKYSSDSIIEPEALIERAIDTNYEMIGITDHFDIIAESVSTHKNIEFGNYTEIIRELSNKYPEIKLALGAEVGEYHWFKSELEDIFGDYAPDYLLASIHFLSNKREISTYFEGFLNKDEIKDYYLMNLNMVEQADFHILGHLGIFNRYKRHEENHVKDLKKEIFKVMIEKGIALEINNSGYSKPINEILPIVRDLDLYFDLGGRLLTIGSDAHTIDLFDKHYDRSIQVIKAMGAEYEMFAPEIRE